jgi:hypothetical protein
MRWFRFNIAGLIMFILICGVAFAALKESSDLWEHGVFSATLLALVTAVLLAIHRTGERRAFWLGFALVGGCYLGFSVIPPIGSRLVSSRGLSYLHSKLPGQRPSTFTLTVTSSGTSALATPAQPVTLSVNGNSSARIWTLNSGNLLTAWGSSTENFVKIGHSLLALLLAWLGGLLSRRLSRPSQPTEVALRPQVDEV